MVIQCNTFQFVNSIHIKVNQAFGSHVSVFPRFINKKLDPFRLLDFGQLEAGAKIIVFVSNNC